MPYRNLSVYQKSYQLALDVHRMTLSFPKIEQYELASQIRRSSKSIPANIVEGMGKQASPSDIKRFLQIALGSCDETTVWLEFAKDLGYINQQIFDQLFLRYQEIGRMMQGLIKRYSSSSF